MAIFCNMCLEYDLPDHTFSAKSIRAVLCTTYLATLSVKSIRAVLWLHFWHLCFKTNLKLKNGKRWHQADHRKAIDCNMRKEARG